MDKFVGILRIHPPPLATEHDFNGHGNKDPEYLSYATEVGVCTYACPPTRVVSGIKIVMDRRGSWQR